MPMIRRMGGSAGRPKDSVQSSTPFASIMRSATFSSPDPVVHVGDTALALEDPGALQLDLLGGEALEETAPLAEEHRDDVELELVEDAGGQSELRGCGAVDQHVLVARRVLGLSHRARHVIHVCDQRPLADVDAGLVAAQDPDRHAVVMVAAQPPAGSKVRRPATTSRRWT